MLSTWKVTELWHEIKKGGQIQDKNVAEIRTFSCVNSYDCAYSADVLTLVAGG